ncbi:MAG: Uma2 family endonuclease [Planctomycetota bacterium]|nr:Uma2 family endonuclease [Planctomycetota bacterium]
MRTASPQRPRSRVRHEPAWDVAHMFPAQGTWTEEDYFALITQRGYELCDGRLEMLPMPTELHQFIAKNLFLALNAFVEARKLGTVLFMGLRVRTRPGEIREPDIVFMRAENADRRANQAWSGADLALEIVSQDDPGRDWKTKRREYARCGIAEYWIVDPQKGSITVLALERGAYKVHGEFGKGDTAASALLPGFSVEVSRALKPEGAK